MKRFLTSLACALTGLISADAASIVWVSFHPGDDTPSSAALTAGFTRAPDAGYTDLLRNAGHTVTRVVSADNLDTNPTLISTLNAADLVIISRSVPSAHYQAAAERGAWNSIQKPTIILGGYILRGSRLGYTGGDTIPDTSSSAISLRAQVPGHPIFAGIALDANGRMVNPYATSVSFTNRLQRGISVNTSPIATGGIVLGTIGNPTDPALGGMVIGEWLSGDATATTPFDAFGSHRLVLLTGSREHEGLTPEGSGMYDLAADGAQIFLNAVNYMTSSRISVHTVNTINNDAPAAGETSLLQAITAVQPGDTIRFKIPGAGPHVITTPMGGYPLITANSVNIDGYTQPGSVRNSNTILSNNNAQIKIVLDSSSTETAPNPANAALPLSRSTRLDFPNDVGNTGYGTTENCVLGIYQADSVTVRGLSFLGRRTPGDSDATPKIYGVALIREALNARIQGCWFGLAPGAAYTLDNVKPVASAVAAFRWRIGGDVFSGGAIVGTDGDGATDRGEFNVMLGGAISMAMELPNLRVSGNFVNVFPDGKTFLDMDANHALWGAALAAAGEDPTAVTLENFENGRQAHNTVIGTNGDGVSDADERNVFNHVVYDHAGEVYSAGTNMVVAGNYYGVGVDGLTKAKPSTNVAPDFIELPGNASIRIGSNGDGVSDAIEGNVIHNFGGRVFCVSGSSVPIVARRNVLVNNQFAAVPFADGDNSRTYLGYYATFVTDANALVPPVVSKFTNNIISGAFALPNGNYPNAQIDVYLLDADALANQAYLPKPVLHPGRWIGSFVDNGAGDLNPTAGEFTYSLASLAPSATTYVAVTVTYSQDATGSAAGRAATSPLSNPISPLPVLNLRRLAADSIELWWLGPAGGSVLQLNDAIDLPNNWFEFFGENHAGGRSSAVLPFDPATPAQFFRLLAQ